MIYVNVGGVTSYNKAIRDGRPGGVFFFRCTHLVKDDLQLSRFVGWG